MDWETVEKNIKKECNTHKKSSEYQLAMLQKSLRIWDTSIIYLAFYPIYAA